MVTELVPATLNSEVHRTQDQRKQGQPPGGSCDPGRVFGDGHLRGRGAAREAERPLPADDTGQHQQR